MMKDEKNDEVEIKISDLDKLIHRCLGKFGLNDEDARLIRDVLMYAELRGKSQGLAKIVERTVEPARDAKPMEISNRGLVVTHIRCRGEVGMVVLNRAASLACDAAIEYGLGAVSTSHTASSTGSIGYYAEKIAERDCIAIVLAGSPKVMAVINGSEPVMGTNPIAIAVPTDHGPLVFDMATSAVTWFELIEAARTGRPVDPNLALNPDGQPTTDAGEAMAGALRSFGGYKGSGLGLMFELLTGPLAGAAIAGDAGDNRGNLVIALNPQNFAGLSEFKKRSTALLDRIRQGRPEQDSVPIQLPGEGSRERAAQCTARGSLIIDQDILTELNSLAEG